MPKVFTITGANNADELKRLAAFEELQEQPTVILERLVELGKIPQAKRYLKNGLLFQGLKAFLKR